MEVKVINPVEVGDKVLLRSDINHRMNDRFNVGITLEMERLAGTVVTVKRITEEFRRARSGNHDLAAMVFSIEEGRSFYNTDLIAPLDADKAFKSFVAGYIDEETYKRITEGIQRG